MNKNIFIYVFLCFLIVSEYTNNSRIMIKVFHSIIANIRKFIYLFYSNIIRNKISESQKTSDF
jgi:hypothetical protein